LERYGLRAVPGLDAKHPDRPPARHV